MKTLRVRPVLVETTEKSRICHLTPKGIQYKDLRFLEIECSIILDSINYDIVLISLDDCANVGDMYYDEHNNLVLKATEYTDHKVYLYKKVIANQKQFSDELTEKLVEEYNNGCMNDFEIEMNVVTMCQSSLKYDNDDILVNGEIVDSFDYSLTEIIDKTIEEYNKPKLINGYITPVQNKEIQKPLNDYINQRHNQDRCIGFINGYETKQSEKTNLYTENEVKELFECWFAIKIDEELKRLSGELDLLDCVTFDKFFEVAKKK